MQNVPSFIKALPTFNLRFVSLLGAILVYGLFGAPTPDHPGWPEILVGGLLIVAIGTSGFLTLFRARFSFSWQYAGYALFIYGLTVPTLFGVMNGHGAVRALRDILPFLFLLLPFFLFPSFETKDVATNMEAKKNSTVSSEQKQWILTLAVVVSGWLFAARVAMPFFLAQGLITDPAHFVFSDPGYLANAPTVLFAALMLAAAGGAVLFRRLGFVSFMKMIGLLLLGMVPVVTMIGVMQRAYFGYYVAAVLSFLVIGVWRRPTRAVVPLMLFALLVWGFWPVLGEAVDMFLRKSSLVGMNMRWQEAVAVFDVLQSHPLRLLFGGGWGTVFQSPAVGGVTVNFTHSLLTSYLLKTGFIGVALVLVYLFLLVKQLFPLFWKAPVISLALTGPLLVNILLYASFKSLDFGLLLLLIPVWCSCGRFSRVPEHRDGVGSLWPVVAKPGGL